VLGDPRLGRVQVGVLGGKRNRRARLGVLPEGNVWDVAFKYGSDFDHRGGFIYP
jgi:hypothetical protein